MVSQTTVPELVELRADEQPDDTAYTFVDYESDPAGVAESLTWSELRTGSRWLPRRWASWVHPGSGRWWWLRRVWSTWSASSGRSGRVHRRPAFGATTGSAR